MTAISYFIHISYIYYDFHHSFQDKYKFSLVCPKQSNMFNSLQTPSANKNIDLLCNHHM